MERRQCPKLLEMTPIFQHGAVRPPEMNISNKLSLESIVTPRSLSLRSVNFDINGFPYRIPTRQTCKLVNRFFYSKY